LFKLVDGVIDRQVLTQKVMTHESGGFVCFEGLVRNHNQGLSVESLEYQAYQELTESEGSKIVNEALEKFNLHRAICYHRQGHLKIGDIAVWIGVSSAHRDDSYQASRYIIDQIKLRLPIWKKEHYTNQASRWVFCKDHHSHVHLTEKGYFIKQSQVLDHNLLMSKKVLVVGAGGLGCPVLLGLSSSGVGSIEIIDNDKVSATNLHRQYLYTLSDIGERKVDIAVKRIVERNPFVKITSQSLYLTSSNINSLSLDYDLVIDCTDNLQTKYLLHDFCFKSNLPLITASVYKYEATIRSFDPSKKNGCWRCHSTKTPHDGLIGNCNDQGVVGASVNLVGSLQALEAIRFLVDGINDTVKNNLLINLKNFSQIKIKNTSNPDCKVCKGDLELIESEFEIDIRKVKLIKGRLVDIRNQVDGYLEKFTDSADPIVVYCHRGVKSKQLVKELRNRGYRNFYSLIGGECSL
jgi:adenylyltransferase/sulfurtransferase